MICRNYVLGDDFSGLSSRIGMRSVPLDLRVSRETIVSLLGCCVVCNRQVFHSDWRLMWYVAGRCLWVDERSVAWSAMPTKRWPLTVYVYFVSAERAGLCSSTWRWGSGRGRMASLVLNLSLSVGMGPYVLALDKPLDHLSSVLFY